ncbi:MAG: primosomal protein N' [bacterium]
MSPGETSLDVMTSATAPPDALGQRLVEVAPLGLPLGALTYRLAEGAVDPPLGGMVLVPVGGRRVRGVVVGPGHPIAGRDLKPVLAQLDEPAPVPSEVLRLARWAADYYLAPLGEVLRLALPPGAARAESATLAVTDAGRELLADTTLDAGARALLEHLATRRRVSQRALLRAVGGTHARRQLRSLEQRGAIARGGGAPATQHRPRRSYRVARDVTPEEVLALARRAPKLAAVWARVVALATPVEAADLAELGADVAPRLERLTRRGWLARTETRSGAGDRHVLMPASDRRPALTDEQRAALEAIDAARDAGRDADPIVLLGVTGSGKTEVYLAAVEATLACARTALVLVPEIALTPLALGRFRQRFGDAVGVLHSGLGDAERAAEWARVLRGETRVLVGTRLAVFAPLADLGLIVVDEEHDGSYKQETGARYHARDLAVVRGRFAGAAVVLGSATPSIETYWNARSGRYRLVELTGRPGGAILPTIEVVDVRRAENRLAGSSRLSRPIAEALAENAARGEQSLLFLNRRGWAPLLVCESCGDRPGCARCSVSLALHRRPSRLVCHLCGAQRPIPECCARCGAAELRRLGAGTQRIEDELLALLPDLRIERLDRDAVASAAERTRALTRVASRAVDVLVGTQMVAKGHDFPHVTFAAVLSIDGLLARSDFRAVERAFQLLVQVSGRAGRAERPGRVVLQSFHPEHSVFHFAKTHDVKGFLDEEIEFRRGSGYPPFGRLAAIGVEGTVASAVEQDARWLADELGRRAAGKSPRIDVLGPAPALVERVDEHLRRRVLLRAERPRLVQTLIAEVLGNPPRVKAPRGSRLAVDVDPLVLL